MRFADLATRAAALLAIAAAAGCSSVSEPMSMFRSSGTPAQAAAQSGPPVNPTVQHTFDDAARALREGRSIEAERGFRALVQSNPELGGPHANLGLIYRQGGKLADSATELETAVRLSPRQPLYFNQLGITYRQQGAFDKARGAYEKAIALDPQYAAPTLNLGILSDLYLGDSARALELYTRYLALSPSGDVTVTKWVADLKNRKSPPITLSRREKE